jgi:hypothetical protein
MGWAAVVLMVVGACGGGDPDGAVQDASGRSIDSGARDGSADTGASIHYVEGGAPVVGAAVLISDLDGATLAVLQTDDAGLVEVLPDAWPVHATVVRQPLPTRQVPAPQARALTVLVDPGDDLTIGSSEPEYDPALAGAVGGCWEAEPERTYVVTLESAVSPSGDNRDGDGNGCTDDPVPVGAMDDPSVDVLVTAVSLDGPPHPFALVTGVDLTPLSDGEPRVVVDLPAWRTDATTTAVTMRSLEVETSSLDVTSRLHRGDRWFRLNREFDFSPGTSETLTVSYPPGFGDSLAVRAAESTQFFGTGRREVIRHVDGTPATVDIDMSAAPWWNGSFELVQEGSVVREARWVDVVPPRSDAVRVTLSHEFIERWDILLPAGTTRFAFPALPEPFSEWTSTLTRPIGLSISQIDSSWVDGYQEFVAGWTADAVLAPAVGDETRLGAAAVDF